MEIFDRMLNTQLQFLLYIIIGFILRRMNKITPTNRPALLFLLLYVSLPAMVLNSFDPSIGMEAFHQSLPMILVITVCIFFGLLLAWLMFHRRAQPQKCVLYFASMFSNMGNAGLPILATVFGASGVLYASMSLIPVVILMWTVGLNLFLPSADWKTRLKKIMNPSMLAIVIGLVRMFTGMPLPLPISGALTGLGGMAAPLCMILAGSTLAEIPYRELINRDAVLLSFTRLIVQPLVTLGVMRLLGLSELLTAVAVVIAAMPAASNTAIFSESFGGDYHLASRCVALSTLVSIVSVPLIALLL